MNPAYRTRFKQHEELYYFKTTRDRTHLNAPFDPDDMNSFQIFLRELTRLALVFLQFDPFLIYKKDHSNKHKQLYRNFRFTELEIKSDSSPKLQKSSRWAGLILCAYLSFKFTSNCVVQLILYQHSKRAEHQDGSSDLFMDFVIKYADTVGNPLKSLVGFSIFIYSALTVTIIYGFVVIPYLQSIRPFDAGSWRFMLDPLREIKRIDMVIEERLISLMLVETGSKRLILDQMPFIHTMRPSNYKPDWYFTLHRSQMTASILIAITIVSILFTFIPLLFHISGRGASCEQLLISSTCSIWSVWTRFNNQDVIALIELHVGLTTACTLFANQVVVMLYSFMSQQFLIKDIKRDLEKCLETISTITMVSSSPDQISLIDSSTSCRIYSDRRSLEHKRSSVDSAAKLVNREMDTNILRTLIKLLLTEEELRKNADFISRITESFLTSMTCSLLLMFVGERLDDIQLGWFRSVIIAVIWLGLNLVIVTCADMYARIIHLEQVAWSILARISANASLLSKEQVVLPTTRISSLDEDWRRLVCGHTLSDLRKSVRPFNMSLTYKRVIKLNFLVVSFASLVRYS